MIEVRIHGRGGQGNVVAAYLLASAAIEAGRHGQAFPAFGAERRGAPVAAFARIADAPIQRRSQVREPHFLVVQDPALLALPEVLSGLRPGGGIVVDSAERGEALSERLGCAVLALPASALAREVVGRPIPNVALLAALLAATRLLPEAALSAALAHQFSGEILARNERLIARVATELSRPDWTEASHAQGA